MILTILIFLAVLALLVLVHELGHFLTAKAYGIKVLEFGFGFPPRILGVRRGETVYSINLIPLGGFVKLLGEEDPSDPRSLAGKSVLTRFLVLFAGPGMNVLLPIVLFSIVFMVPQKAVNGRVQIQGVSAGSPAALAGVKPGDIVVKVDGTPVANHQELIYQVALNLGSTTTWELVREKPLLQQAPQLGGEPGLVPPPPPAASETLFVKVTPRWKPPEGQGHVGVIIATVNPRVVALSYPFWEAVPRAFKRTGETLVLFRNEITSWIIGASRPQLAGPIAIAQATGEVAQMGWGATLQFTALLSLFLAIMNILPIPALDGGRLLFVGIEWVRRGKRISPQREGLVHLVGFIVLLCVVAVISYFDISRILSGERLLQ
ncbi:MAG: site-2 protease family protein [Chloroflexi bacterium]|nr:site-2 protease family protein [Chloroflexota bacterium]